MFSSCSLWLNGIHHATDVVAARHVQTRTGLDMNYWISILFRAIPLGIAAICLGYGLTILHMGHDANSTVAGHVVAFLAAICIALFTTAATIIRQLIHTDKPELKVLLPLIGYLAAATAMAAGLSFIADGSATGFVAGHVVFGLGLISCCVATVATVSAKFILIPRNSRATPNEVPPDAFGAGVSAFLICIPIICAFIGLLWGLALIFLGSAPEYYVAGHVLAGIGFVCASLVALVASIIRQIRNTYCESEGRAWPLLVLIAGSCDLVWGLYLLLADGSNLVIAPGYVLIGLGIVCYSILSKVLLLSLVWRHPYPLAKRVPLIPVLTALGCLFLAAFLFEMATLNPAYAVPARVLVGLGGVCFTLFSIVSILESGTSD